MADKSLLDFVRREDHAATDDLFSAALLPRDDPARGCNRQPLVFRHSTEKRLIPAECAIVADAGDPSIHLVGVRRKDEAVASSKEAEATPTPTRAGTDAVEADVHLEKKPLPAAAQKPSSSSSKAETTPTPTRAGTDAVQADVHLAKKFVPAAAPKPSSSSSKGLSKAAPKVMSLGSLGGGGGFKLTAAALAFSSGLAAPLALPRKAPVPTATKDVPSVSSREDVPVPTFASGGVAPGGRPPAASGGGPPLAPGSPDKSDKPTVGPTPSKSTPPRTSGRQSSAASPPRARVLQTQLVLRDDEGAEQWSSSQVMLGEQISAAELLTKDGLALVGMPKEFSDTVSPETHLLYVLNDTSGDLLQVANLVGIPLKSLLRHCGPEGVLSIVLAPVEDSEDAFETMPGINDDD